MRQSRLRPRFTVRSLMIAVAVVGLGMGSSGWIIQMRLRSAAYAKQSFNFGMISNGSDGKGGQTEDGRPVNLYDNENDWRKYVWATRLAEKYHRLAERPWLPLEADPLPPERLAHPRRARELPADYPSWGFRRHALPWWTFLWTWHNG